MNSWKTDEAKARFAEFIEAALNNGPQILASEGREVAVLVSIETWRQLCFATHSNIKSLLLAPEPRFDDVFPRRRKLKRRPPLDFK